MYIKNVVKVYVTLLNPIIILGNKGYILNILI